MTAFIAYRQLAAVPIALQRLFGTVIAVTRRATKRAIAGGRCDRLQFRHIPEAASVVNTEAAVGR